MPGGIYAKCKNESDKLEFLTVGYDPWLGEMITKYLNCRERRALEENMEILMNPFFKLWYLKCLMSK